MVLTGDSCRPWQALTQRLNKKPLGLGVIAAVDEVDGMIVLNRDPLRRMDARAAPGDLQTACMAAFASSYRPAASRHLPRIPRVMTTSLMSWPCRVVAMSSVCLSRAIAWS